jgi:hypothetical protein
MCFNAVGGGTPPLQAAWRLTQNGGLRFANPRYWQSPTCSPSMETVVLTTSRPAIAPFDTIVAV